MVEQTTLNYWLARTIAIMKQLIEVIVELTNLAFANRMLYMR